MHNPEIYAPSTSTYYPYFHAKERLLDPKEGKNLKPHEILRRAVLVR